MTPKSEFLHTLQTRGFLQDCTALETMDDAMRKGILPGYLGFDMTANSLHVGNLVQIMLLRWLQKTGHKPVVLMGGGTTRIGDPSGKDEARQLLTSETIASNMAGIREIFGTYLSFGDGETDAIMANNADWLDELNYIDFLRDYGRHFTINRMLTFDSVKLRLDREQPLTFLEFNYMLLQAYDFLELSRRHGVRFQMGGSDQWGNIVNGVELCRRVDQTQVFGVTTPLITKADGSKMGKSAAGAVWLNEERLSHFDFWQFWRNTADADVGRFLRLFTEVPLDEIARLEVLQGAEINEAKITLANATTTMARGPKAAESAMSAARDVFQSDGSGEDLPTVSLTTDEIGDGMTVAQLFVRAGLAGSGKEAKRLVADKGARLDGTPAEDPGQVLTPDQLQGLKISAGRKRHARVSIGD